MVRLWACWEHTHIWKHTSMCVCIYITIISSN